MMRWGLCCGFRDAPIRFRTTTASTIIRMKRADALVKLSQLCLANADALNQALTFCAANGIGCFRINSGILPVKTHPTCGYDIDELPDSEEIVSRFEMCGVLTRAHNLRTTFHPDQFVVLNSPRSGVLASSLRELEYQAQVAEWVGADVINIHAGGSYGDKTSALTTLAQNVDRLPAAIRSRLTIENDDKVYTPQDLLWLCRSTGLPLVYDVHHHRCLPDGMNEEDATLAAVDTWNREPLFHISSPLDGWCGSKPERHHDLIDPADFPGGWLQLPVTVEIEAKAKEIAVLRLQDQLASRSTREMFESS